MESVGEPCLRGPSYDVMSPEDQEAVDRNCEIANAAKFHELLRKHSEIADWIRRQ